MSPKSACLFSLLASLTIQVSTSLNLPLPVQHPQFPFQPYYLRQYSISSAEAETLSICKTLTHDCDWGLIVVIRQESCIPDDFVLNMIQGDESALECPLLVQGYSIYDSDNTSPDIIPHKYHLTNQPGVDLPVFVYHRDAYAFWEVDNNKDFTYGDLVQWAEENDSDVYRGVATEYFESVSNNVNPDALDMNNTLLDEESNMIQEGDLSVVVKGVLMNDHEFSFTIDEVGDSYTPIIWDVRLTGGKAYKEEDEDGLDQGKLAGAIIGSAVFGMLVATLFWAVFGKKSSSNRENTLPVTSTGAAASTTPQKDVEPTESHHD